MKNILVPTDFSGCARNAENAAILIADKLKATIHFLHITPNYDENFHVPHTTNTLIQTPVKGHARNELNELVSKASHLGILATPLLVFDTGNERIENYIESLKIDLVIMGSHGASGIREFVIGSNTQRVVRHSPVPVLVIKDSVHDQFKLNSIVFASTFKTDITKAFDVVVGLARLWKATVHILFINFIDKVADQDMMNSIVSKLSKPYSDISFTSNTAEVNDEEWGIHQFVEMVDADMIALTTQDKTGFLVRHSVAEDMVNHEEIPVLVIS